MDRDHLSKILQKRKDFYAVVPAKQLQFCVTPTGVNSSMYIYANISLNLKNDSFDLCFSKSILKICQRSVFSLQDTYLLQMNIRDYFNLKYNPARIEFTRGDD